MRACILAAGSGQRLRPLTDDRPKALIEVDGITFLDRQLTQLAAVGVREVVIATGWCEEAVARAIRSAPLTITLCRNDRFDSTQNGVSLAACADALLAGGARDTFKLDGDVILDVEVLHRLMAARAGTGAGLVAAIDCRGGLGAEEMKVTLETKLDTGPGPGRTRGTERGDRREEGEHERERERISAFGKWIDPASAAGESIGVELIGGSSLSSFLDTLRALGTVGETNLYYEDVYHRLLPAQGGTLEAIAVSVGDLPWTEVDTIDDLARAATIARRTRLTT